MQKTKVGHRVGARIVEVAILVALPITCHYVIPVMTVVPGSYSDLGLVLMLVGLALMTWVSMLFRGVGTSLQSHGGSPVLVTSGPFRFTRNPMYLGKLIWVVGLAVLLGSLIVFLFPVLFFVFANLVIVPLEERRMEQMLGEQFIEYKRRVRRWL